MIQDTSSDGSAEEDRMWISVFQEGEISVFGRIFDKYKSRVVNIAFRILREKSAAEDIAQDVFIKVYEKKYRFDPNARFSTWLYRVTVNASLDVLRKKKFFGPSLNSVLRRGGEKNSSPLEMLADPAPRSDEKMEKEELKILLQKEIDGLPEGLKIPLVLHQFEELSYQEISRILNISVKAVERRLYRARMRLRKVLRSRI